MDGWNLTLLAASGFVAVTGLVRLMLARRNKLVLELREQAEAEQRPSSKPNPIPIATGPRKARNRYPPLLNRVERQFDMAKQLYIETVGCQMNMLDSELVVASLPQAGLRAGRHAAPRPTRSCSTRAASGSMPKTRSTRALGRLKHAKNAQPAQDHRRAGLHGSERPAADLRAGARTST